MPPTCPKPFLFIFFWISLLYTTVAEGQIRKRFQSLTVDDGLAQNSVQAILQDYKGYLWIGTADGLNRYDGNQFYQYKRIEGDSTSLIGTSIYSLFEDSRKNLWISSDKGVSVYLRALDSFKNFEMPYGIVAAEDQKGRVWVANQKGQLIAFESRDQSIAKVIHLGESQGRLRRGALFGNSIYLGSAKGLVKIDTESDAASLLPGKLTGLGVHFLIKDNRVHCFHGTERYELTGDSIRRFSTRDFDVQSANYNSFLLEWNSHILAGNSSGLYIFDYPGWNVVQKISSFDPSNQNLFFM